jgi:hypothetical protein
VQVISQNATLSVAFSTSLLNCFGQKIGWLSAADTSEGRITNLFCMSLKDAIGNALNRCIELVAASVAERMLLEDEPVPSVSDVEHTIKYASLVCRSPEAAERFIRLCETMADDLLRPYGYVLIALSTVLRIRHP